jgi:rubrerythrin
MKKQAEEKAEAEEEEEAGKAGEPVEYECPSCGAPVGENDKKCAKCGAEFE